MSKIVPLKNLDERYPYRRYFHKSPTQITFSPYSSPVVSFNDGTSAKGTCLACRDARCIELEDREISLGEDLSSFPGDPSKEVCPTRAIDWESNSHFPIIDADSCFGCGLCVARCPFGAITLDASGKASVESSDPDGITTTLSYDLEPSVPIAGSLGDSHSPFFLSVQDIVRELNDVQTSKLIRNLFCEVTSGSNIRRKGDSNVRVDALARFCDGMLGVIEIEPSSSVLESPRALLEDVAILHARYDQDLATLIPISVVVSLPNVRVEYYQVMADIEKVLGIRCHTITLGALVLLAWHFSHIDVFDRKQFFVNSDRADLYPSLSKLIDELPDDEPYAGAFRPAK